MEKRLWTVQTKEVLDIIEKDGIYKPDFSLSTYAQESKETLTLYNMFLEAFNNVNNFDAKGLVYTFMCSDNSNLYYFMNLNEFKEQMVMGKNVIRSLWDSFLKRDCIIMELSYSSDFNPLLIDINDFQFLMPPVLPLHPYTEADAQRLVRDIYDGIIEPSVFPSGIIQAHVPYIRHDNVLNIYPMFDLE